MRGLHFNELLVLARWTGSGLTVEVVSRVANKPPLFPNRAFADCCLRIVVRSLADRRVSLSLSF